MSLYELDVRWAATENARRYLHWELLACDEVLGVFEAARDDTLAVLFNGGRVAFRAWAGSLERVETTTTTTTTRKGALG